VYNFFSLNQTRVRIQARSDYYRELREGAFVSWNRAVGI
jgi:hypothetical protein